MQTSPGSRSGPTAGEQRRTDDEDGGEVDGAAAGSEDNGEQRRGRCREAAGAVSLDTVPRCRTATPGSCSGPTVGEQRQRFGAIKQTRTRRLRNEQRRGQGVEGGWGLHFQTHLPAPHSTPPLTPCTRATRLYLAA